MMIAQVTDLQPGDFIHTFGDVHLYVNHIEQAKIQLERNPLPLPRMQINPRVKSIFEFDYSRLRIDRVPVTSSHQSAGVDLIISLIVAMDRGAELAMRNKLPWRLPADLKRFRELTMGHHLIVGRKTWESIGRLLSGRQLVILTHDRDLAVPGAAVAHSLGEALSIARNHDDGEAFIGGGADVYAQALPIADRIYLTLVDGEFQADTFFPEIDPRRWEEKSSQSFTRDEKNGFDYTFKLLERKVGSRANSRQFGVRRLGAALVSMDH